MKRLVHWSTILKEYFFQCYSFWVEREHKPWREAWELAKSEVMAVKRDPFSPHGNEAPPEQIAEFIQWLEKNDNIRRCSVCGKPMTEGYYLDGDYACSDECRNEWYMKHGDTRNDLEAAIKEYYQDSEEDDSEYYWTDWEEQHFYFD